MSLFKAIYRDFEFLAYSWEKESIAYTNYANELRATQAADLPFPPKHNDLYLQADQFKRRAKDVRTILKQYTAKSE